MTLGSWLLYQQARRLRCILPGECLICAQPTRRGIDLCRTCQRQLPRNLLACSHCQEPLDRFSFQSIDGHCSRCHLHPPAYDQAWAFWRYQPPLDQLLLRFKYQGDRNAGQLFIDLMLNGLKHTSQQTPVDALLCIPANPSRVRQRHLHAPTWLAKNLAACMNRPFLPQGLILTQCHPSQQGLSQQDRWKNPKGAFRASSTLANRHLLLVDDVMTTGATLHWAAHALKQVGVASVTVTAPLRAAQT